MTMDAITFYDKSGQLGTHLRVFDRDAGTRMAVYLRDPTAQAGESLRQGEPARLVHQNLASMAVTVRRTNNGTRIETFFPPSAGAPTIVRLRLGGEVASERVKVGVPVDLSSGEHLIVPVNAESGEDLHSLMELLKGFPDDLRRVVLETIRRPLLEARVNDLIDLLYAQEVVHRPAEADEAPRRAADLRQALIASSRNPLLTLGKRAAGYVVACVLGALAVFALLHWRGSGSSQAAEVTSLPPAAAPAVEPAQAREDAARPTSSAPSNLPTTGLGSPVPPAPSPAPRPPSAAPVKDAKKGKGGSDGKPVANATEGKDHGENKRRSKKESGPDASARN